MRTRVQFSFILLFLIVLILVLVFILYTCGLVDLFSQLCLEGKDSYLLYFYRNLIIV